MLLNSSYQESHNTKYLAIIEIHYGGYEKVKTKTSKSL